MRNFRLTISLLIAALGIAVGPVGAQVRGIPERYPGGVSNGGVIGPFPTPTISPAIIDPTVSPTLTPTLNPNPGTVSVDSGGGGGQTPPNDSASGLPNDADLFAALVDAATHYEVIDQTPLIKKRKLMLGAE